MAAGGQFVPSPPSNEFLETLFASQQASQSTRKFGTHRNTRPAIFDKTDRELSTSFGGEGFYDINYQHGGYSTYSGNVLQTVPSITAELLSTPSTINRHVTCNDSIVPHTDSTLVPVTEIPQRFRCVFSNFSSFNLIQSKVFNDVMYTDKHIVTSAPTGSGKTVIFELAIVRILIQLNVTINSLKIVYVAPIKALCSERYAEWSSKFGVLGLRCAEVTGDSQLDDYFELQNAQIILTTPEKWDSMTRKWRDNKSLVQLVQLFLIDEVHQLNDSTRGPTVEAIVSRMKTIRASVDGNNDKLLQLRFIAVSATIPNIDDIAKWLGTEDHPAISHYIDDTYRPVKLRRVVLGFTDTSTEFKFDLSLNYKLSSAIQCYSDQKPTLVFCSTRKGTQQAASILVKDARFVLNVEHKRRLQSVSSSLNESKLRELVMFGVGYHHAGLSINDRKSIETLFINGELPVLFSTSTLAMGVNLPAHLVIIKSTLHYVGGSFQEYTESQILQMIGRAGRPQYDTYATAVIMTRNSTKAKYEALLGGTQVIESNLHSHLIEHLNAEIVLHTITDITIAMEWLKSTFLYIRIKNNPKHYNIPEHLSSEELEEQLQEMCLKDLHLLQSNNLINMDDGFVLAPTEIGRLMARYYIAFDSMKSFIKLIGNESLEELVGVLSMCQEFDEVRLRVNERKILNQLNKDKHRLTIRFPLSGKIKTTDMKVNCLIQATLGCLSLQEFSLNQDTQKIFRSASRLCKCLMELLLINSNYTVLLNAVLLHKCIQSRLWENSKHVAKQLDKIGVALSTIMVNSGLTSFNKILETNPRELELIVNRHPPFGNQIKEAVTKLPQYSLTIEQSATVFMDHSELLVTVSLINFTTLTDNGSTAGPSHTCILIVGDEDNNIVFKQKIVDSQLLTTGKWSNRITVQQANNGHVLQFHYISLEYVGIDIHQSFTPQYVHKYTPLKTPNKEQYVHVETKEHKSNKVRCKQCNHRCINKIYSCGHECCKYGLEQTSTSGRTEDSTNYTAVAKLTKETKLMTDHVKHIHQRVQCLPPTPGLKRLKVMRTDYRDYLPNNLRNEYSYTPKDKLIHSQLPSTSNYTPTLEDYLIDNEGIDDEDLLAIPDIDDDDDYISCTPPPLPSPVQLNYNKTKPSNSLSLPLKELTNKSNYQQPKGKFTQPNIITKYGHTPVATDRITATDMLDDTLTNNRMFSITNSSMPANNEINPPAKKLCQRNLCNDLSKCTSENTFSFFTSKQNVSTDDHNDDIFGNVFAGIF